MNCIGSALLSMANVADKAGQDQLAAALEHAKSPTRTILNAYKAAKSDVTGFISLGCIVSNLCVNGSNNVPHLGCQSALPVPIRRELIFVTWASYLLSNLLTSLQTSLQTSLNSARKPGHSRNYRADEKHSYKPCIMQNKCSSGIV